MERGGARPRSHRRRCSGATGLLLGRGLAGDGVRRVRNAPGLTEGLGEVLLGLAAAWGGAAAKTLAGASALGDAKGYGLR